ncbi:hypothetical protein RMATCC62417_09963 [Rhizopus microsporus]|nr:hypothetical protein RMATCC62417_09963 [Rhizopus microsporus]
MLFRPVNLETIKCGNLFDKLRASFSKLWSRQMLTIAFVALLLLFGPVLMSVDLAYLTGKSFRMGDLYAYLTFIGIISLWCFLGLVVIVMKSVRGMTIFAYGLLVLTVVQFLIGFVHIVLLYNTYRPVLMNNCMQRQPYPFFWWAANYEENQEFKQIFDKCMHQWSQFSSERLISWIVYSAASGLVLAAVIIHKRHISDEYQKARGYIVSDQEGEWASEEKPTNEGAIRLDRSPPPYGGDEEKEMMDVSMHQQRQKLYDEIAKRKRAKKNLNRKSVISNSSDPASVSVVHPLDLTKDPGIYQPPPMPPKDSQESWNRYEGTSVGDDERQELERQRRFNSHTSERLEYELFKSHEPQAHRRHSSFGEKRRSSRRKGSRFGSSQRHRPVSLRWSSVHADTAFTPLIEKSNDPEVEEHEEDQEMSSLMKPEDSEPSEQASY